MYETEAYLSNVRRNLYPRLFTVFFISAAVFLASCIASYFVCSYFSGGTYYQILPIEDEAGILKTLCVTRLPSLIIQLLLLMSVFSVFNKAAVILISLWRGLSIGCFVALASGGMIMGLGSKWSVGVVFFLIETIIMFIFSAYTSVYSEVILILRAAEDRFYPAAISAEMIKLALIFCGGIFLTGAAAEIFLIYL